MKTAPNSGVPLAYREFLRRMAGLHARGMSLDLSRMRDALARLGHPERSFPCVQIAGTNGKGSTAAMTESICRASGLRTGLFTSPHLCRFTERIRLDGEEIDPLVLAALFDRIAGAGPELTYFETSLALALVAMAEREVGVAILETGLGGRLDAVTAVPACATAITSIALDHQEILGTTLVEIAREKAGIARAGVPLFLAALEGPGAGEAVRVIEEVAAAAGAPVRRQGSDFQAPPVLCALPGPHQLNNAAVAVALAVEIGRQLVRPIGDREIENGLARVRWPGRFEWIARDVLLDGAHNPEAARALVRSLEGLPPEARPAALVISIVNGKDVAGILAPLAQIFSTVFVTRSANQRAMPVAELERAATQAGPWRVWREEDPRSAVTRARQSGTLVVVAGSLFLVGEVRAWLTGQWVDGDALSDPTTVARKTK